MAEKRYFWLKLYDDFFTSKRIKKLRSIAGGDTYTIIYLKMQLKALKTDGYLFYDGVMENFADEIALDIDEEPEDVKITIQYLLSVGLMECSDNGSEYCLTYMHNVIGSETAHAQRQRDYIQRKKCKEASQNDALVTNLCRASDAEKEIEKDKDINTIGDFGKSPDSKSAISDDEIFSALWELYPKKKGKGQVSASKKHKIAKIGFDEMSRCIERYKKTIEGKDQQYTMYGSTFFNSGYVDYLDANYEEESTTGETDKIKEWLAE